MFRNTVKIARIFGIDVELDISWFLVFMLFSFTLSKNYFPGVLPEADETVHWILGITVTVLVFMSVLVHEFAHSLMAIKEEIPISKITLFIFGGIAQMKKEPENPSSELKIAVLGPMASIILAGLFGILYLILPAGQPVTEGVWFLARINLVVGTINLIPAFPLDGGRIFRAFLWTWKDNLLFATRIAVNAGSLFAFFAIGVGFVILFSFTSIWGLWYIFLGWLLYQAGQTSYNQVALRESLSGVKVEDVMSSEVQGVPNDFTIDELVENFYCYKFGAFPVMENSDLKGLVTIHQVKDVPRTDWQTTRVYEIMTPADKCIIVEPDQEAVEAMVKMTAEGAGRVLVVENGKLAGILSNTDMMRLIKIKMLFGTESS